MNRLLRITVRNACPKARLLEIVKSQNRLLYATSEI